MFVFEPGMERVFIVEDNELMLRLYRSVFESLGCATGYATRAEEALRLLSQRRPDLIIMDDILPDGSGADLTCKLRAWPGFGDVPILAVASRATAAAREAMCTAGCNEFIAKPIQVEEFAAAVLRYLARSAEVKPRPGHADDLLAEGALRAGTAMPAVKRPDVRETWRAADPHFGEAA